MKMDVCHRVLRSSSEGLTTRQGWFLWQRTGCQSLLLIWMIGVLCWAFPVLAMAQEASAVPSMGTGNSYDYLVKKAYLDRINANDVKVANAVYRYYYKLVENIHSEPVNFDGPLTAIIVDLSQGPWSAEGKVLAQKIIKAYRKLLANDQKNINPRQKYLPSAAVSTYLMATTMLDQLYLLERPNLEAPAHEYVWERLFQQLELMKRYLQEFMAEQPDKTWVKKPNVSQAIVAKNLTFIHAQVKFIKALVRELKPSPILDDPLGNRFWKTVQAFEFACVHQELEKVGCLYPALCGITIRYGNASITANKMRPIGPENVGSAN